MRTLEVSEATAPLRHYVDDLAEETRILTEGGEPVAALVLLRNVDKETLSLSANPEFIALLEESRSRLRAEGGISLSEIRKRVGAEG